ncbi:MAG: DUF2889 domain-containing protein [Pseudomonadota bacterium]
MNDFVNTTKNPNYGQGTYHRQIRIVYSDGLIRAALEDDLHAFELRVEHDSQRIIALNSEAVRFPFTTCPGANDPLQAFVGLGLDLTSREYNALVNARNNCTHVYDLLLSALFHRGDSTAESHKVEYDIQIDDETKHGSVGTLLINGVQQLEWIANGFELIGPDELAGLPLMRGFSKWAVSRYQGVQQHAAFMLQKGYLVAQARRYESNSRLGKKASDDQSMQGTCHTYSPERSDTSHRTDNPTIEFYKGTTQLLSFVSF